MAILYAKYIVEKKSNSKKYHCIISRTRKKALSFFTNSFLLIAKESVDLLTDNDDLLFTANFFCSYSLNTNTKYSVINQYYFFLTVVIYRHWQK